MVVTFSANHRTVFTPSAITLVSAIGCLQSPPRGRSTVHTGGPRPRPARPLPPPLRRARRGRCPILLKARREQPPNRWLFQHQLVQYPLPRGDARVVATTKPMTVPFRRPRRASSA